ncbi:MAG: sulfite exporter TauE/SafE family protein [Saprospiraceae bacterium]
MAHPEILLWFCIIAFIYASVGFGGGSSYIAILALYSLPFKELRLIALICNIIVVAGGTVLFIKHKEIKWIKLIPLVISGLIMSFLGARLKLSENFFFVLLGCCLIVAGTLLCFERKTDQPYVEIKTKPLRESFLGGSIGFLSGMVGIGGGIFLSPLLNLMKWDTSKKIAATASLFILVNSIGGITGQLQSEPFPIDYTRLCLMAMAVFIGGQAGSRIGIFKLDQQMIKKLTGVLVLAAGIEILLRHLHN